MLHPEWFIANRWWKLNRRVSPWYLSYGSVFPGQIGHEEINRDHRARPVHHKSLRAHIEFIERFIGVDLSSRFTDMFQSLVALILGINTI